MLRAHDLLPLSPGGRTLLNWERPDHAVLPGRLPQLLVLDLQHVDYARQLLDVRTQLVVLVAQVRVTVRRQPDAENGDSVAASWAAKPPSSGCDATPAGCG